MKKENNVEKELLSILAKYSFVPKADLGPCLRRDDKLGKRKCESYVELIL